MNNHPISLKDLPEHLKSKKDTGCVVDMGMIMPEKKKSWLIPSIAACLILVATIGITTYNYAMPQEIIDLFKGQQPSDFIDEAEFANGNLVITNKALKKRLLASSVGLETKLKIIYEKQDLKQDRDINTVGDQMRFHQDNFGGKMGVGIQANAMKVLAYLMYGGKFIFNGKSMLLSRVIDMQYGKDGEVTIIHRDGEGNVVEETGTLSRPKVKLREVKTIVEDGEILYDYEDLNFQHIVLGQSETSTYEFLERETLVKGHYVFEI